MLTLLVTSELGVIPMLARVIRVILERE